MDISRSIRHEIGDRRSRSYNSTYYSHADEKKFVNSSLINNFGDTTSNILTPPILSKHNNQISKNKIAPVVVLENNNNNEPPVLISVTEAQNHADMQKSGEYVTKEKVIFF